VYDATNGSRLASVSAIKISAPVRSCGLSEDCRHLVAAVGGFVFRFEYLGAAKGETDAEDNGCDETNENKDANMAPGDDGPASM